MQILYGGRTQIRLRIRLDKNSFSDSKWFSDLSQEILTMISAWSGADSLQTHIRLESGKCWLWLGTNLELTSSKLKIRVESRKCWLWLGTDLELISSRLKIKREFEKCWLWLGTDLDLTATRLKSVPSLENIDSDLKLLWIWQHPDSESDSSLENIDSDLKLIWVWQPQRLWRLLKVSP